jgi:phosphoribosylformylglycinamidine synthase PurS subunit
MALIPMKAYVYVSLKKSVLDPQGKTIQGALRKMGYQGLQEVRQGKYFEITLNGGLTRTDAQAEVERIAREVLTNPVIEEFRFEIVEDARPAGTGAGAQAGAGAGSH